MLTTNSQYLSKAFVCVDTKKQETFFKSPNLAPRLQFLYLRIITLITKKKNNQIKFIQDETLTDRFVDPLVDDFYRNP